MIVLLYTQLLSSKLFGWCNQTIHGLGSKFSRGVHNRLHSKQNSIQIYTRGYHFTFNCNELKLYNYQGEQQRIQIHITGDTMVISL